MPPYPDDFADALMHRLGDGDRFVQLTRGRSGTVRISFTDRGERSTWGVVVASDEWDRVVECLAEYVPEPDPSDALADAFESMAAAIHDYSTRAAEDARKWAEGVVAALRSASASAGRTEASEGKP